MKRSTTFLLTCALVVSLGSLQASAQSVGGLNYSATANCGSTPTGHVSWPVDNPLWEFDFIQPAQSSGERGSGLEIRNVYYDGNLVFRAAHVPILNVEYEPGGCGCYRDWQYTHADYAADGVRAGSESCVADATAGAVMTTCESNESGGQGGDPGSFDGIAIEDFGSELVLTGNMSAGWYRYRMKWHFYDDGRIWPEFSFSSATDSCTSTTHRHHAYWRFDFDIDGSDGDVVRMINPVAGTSETYTSELATTWGNPDDEIYWTVTDATSQLSYEIVPSAADLLLPVDDFSKLDVAVARYSPSELEDGANSLGECEIELESSVYSSTNPVINGESLVDEDIVVWYRSSANHLGNDPWDCDIVGPTLRRVVPTAGSNPVVQEMPDGYIIERAYPNPFNPTTTVRFKVQERQNVRVTLFDALGREVTTLFNGFVESNQFETIRIDGSGLPSGTYTVRMEGESVLGSTRVVLIK